MNLFASKPFQIFCLDFTFLKKNSEIVGIISYVISKFTIAVPTKDQKATTDARALVEKWFNYFGVPRRLHSDPGRHFESDSIVRSFILSLK